MGTLPTVAQSSPRADMYAMIMLLRHTVGDIVAYSDYLPLVRGLRRDRSYISATSPMLDLWDQLWTLLDAREGSVE
eukprot:1893577-Pyramimonas_sp.AAC.1